jgi:hypothetical protein
MRLRSLSLPSYTGSKSPRQPVSTTLREDEVKLIDQIGEALDELHTMDNRASLVLSSYSRSGTVRILLRFALHHLGEFEEWYKVQMRGF